MANNNVNEETPVKQQLPAPKVQKPKTKWVRNRSGHRVELVIGGKVVVFMPGKNTEVPANAEIPSGLGLHVK